MIRYSDIIDKFRPLVGWQNAYIPQLTRLSDDLLISESGWYYQDAHPLVTIENLKSIAPDFEHLDSPSYEPQVSYRKGDIVREQESGKFYRAKQASYGNFVTDTEYWCEADLFSEWLRFKTDSAIRHVVSEAMASISPMHNSRKNLLDTSMLYSSLSHIYEPVSNTGKLVGYEIELVHGQGVTVNLKRIGLNFTKAGAYTMYIMHSSNMKPVYQMTFTKTKPCTMEWFGFTDVFLPYQGEANDAGGKWYIVYRQSELPQDSEAVRRDLDWAHGPSCSTCSRTDRIFWQAANRFIKLRPVCVDESHITTWEEGAQAGSYSSSFSHSFSLVRSAETGINMWDVKYNEYTSLTYGINLEFTVECDHTQAIIDNKSSFAQALVYQLGYDALTEFAYNSNARINRSSFNASREDLFIGMDGMGTKESNGLKGRLKKAISNIALDFNGLDRICLPCVNNGVKYKSI